MRAATVFVVFVAAGAVLAVASSDSALADTVVLKSGKKIEGVVSSGPDGDPVVLNPYNSRCAEMTYGIVETNKYPRDKVAEVIIADPPLVAYRERASMPGTSEGDRLMGLSAEEHRELAKFCETHKLSEERDRELKLSLCLEPTNAEALAALGRGVWQAWAKGNPLADPDLRGLESEYVKLEKLPEAQAHWDQMVAKATLRQRTYLERARRFACARFQLRHGRRDKVPLTLRSELSPGATYCIHVPKTYDPLVPTGLVVGLHGGGANAKDPSLVTGNGQEAMNFYVDLSDERGVIVVCPSALAAPWSDPKNQPFLDALIEEMKILYNVDESRIWLTGHSMGGYGSWYWGPKRADVWAAFAPCSGGGGSASDAKGLPVYIYHGTDDAICTVGSDRTAADALLKEKADFVYTEIDKTGHGFPDWARKDIFRFFAGRWKSEGKKRAVWPRSSFDRKVTKDEVKCFGDPSPTASASASAAPADAKMSELVAALEKGGGRGVEASAQLVAKHKNAAAVVAVARVLHSKKTTSDARVLAAKTIGEIGLPDGVKPLAAEAASEDFRVVDAVTEALGKLGGKDAVEPLVKAGKTLGAFFEKSNQGGQFDFTEYETRCQSLGGLCDAYAKVGDAAAFLPVLEKEVVARVYAPRSPYSVPVDSRFTEIPPRARLELVRKLRSCLTALKDPRGKALLESVKAAWSKEPALADEATAGIAEL